MITKEEQLYEELLEIQKKSTDLIGQCNRMKNLAYSLAHKHLYQEIELFTNKFNNNEKDNTNNNSNNRRTNKENL
jgi:hypothetical protein